MVCMVNKKRFEAFLYLLWVKVVMGVANLDDCGR
jgi:hypothetical protein